MQITGTSRADELFGEDGDDVILGLQGRDYIFGYIGNDSMFGGAGDDVILGGWSESNFIDGGSGDDDLQGWAGQDHMVGGRGNDSIYGWDGAFAEADILVGSRGRDTFSFINATDLVQGTQPRLDYSSTIGATDTVMDFEGAGAAFGDVISFATYPGDPSRFQFSGRADQMPVPGGRLGVAADQIFETRYAFDGRNTAVFADSNDDGRFDGQDLYVRLSGAQALTIDDFERSTFEPNDAGSAAGRAGMSVPAMNDFLPTAASHVLLGDLCIV